VEGELRLLRLVPRLARATGLRLVPTFLGAHAVAPEYRTRPDAYVDLLIRRALPRVVAERLARFCDVFCEPGFFSVRQSERLLRAALAVGLGVKVHAEEFVLSGGARLAGRPGGGPYAAREERRHGRTAAHHGARGGSGRPFPGSGDGRRRRPGRSRHR